MASASAEAVFSAVSFSTEAESEALSSFCFASSGVSLFDGAENFAEYLAAVDELTPLPDAFFMPLAEKLKHYFITGGMPEPVLVWTEEKDPGKVDRVLSDIISSYESDFGKHAPTEDVPKIRYIWQSLPSQLARDNKKFLYSVVKPGARAREYENALN